MTDPWSYQPASLYYQRQAQDWEAQARTAAFNRTIANGGTDYGYSADVAPQQTTLMDKPVITGRDIDAILKGPGSGGGGGLLGSIGGIISDAADTAFLGPIHKPWDVLRPVKRIMDAENRYIARPVASGLYEGVTGKDYEDANPIVKGILETAASPSTYLGPGILGKLGKASKLTALERFATTESLPKYLGKALAGNVGGVLGGAAADQVGLPPIVGSVVGSAVAGRPFERGKPSIASAVEGEGLPPTPSLEDDPFAPSPTTPTPDWVPGASARAAETPSLDTSGGGAGDVPGDTTTVAGEPPAPGGGINAVPDEHLRNLLGGSLPQPGLTKTDVALNALKRTIGIGTEDNELATPIMRARGELKQRAGSMAERMSAISGLHVNTVFGPDETGRIPSLTLLDEAGNTVTNAAGEPLHPTIQDVAAKAPLYDRYLNEDQKGVLAGLRNRAELYNKALTEQGVEFTSRPDIIDGGFYLPRGTYTAKDAIPVRRLGLGGAQVGAKKGFQQEAEFNSMAEGLAQGGTFEPFQDAFKGYANDAAEQAINAHTANLFKALTDENGKPLSQSAASRVPSGLRDRVDRLRSQISSTRDTLRRQEVAAAQADREFARNERTAKGSADRATTSQARAAARDAAFKPEDLSAASDALYAAVKDGRSVAIELGGNLEKLRSTRGAYGAEEQALQKQVDALTNQLNQADALTGSVTTQNLSGGTGSLSFENSPSAQKQYSAMLRNADAISKGIDNIGGRAEKLASKVDSLTERGDILKDMDASQRDSYVQARRTERQLTAQDRQLAVAKREAELLALEQQRAEKLSNAAGGRYAIASNTLDDTRAKLTNLQQDLADISDKWQSALTASRQTPREMGQIGIMQLQGTSFPVDVANAANKFLKAEAPGGELRGAIKTLNGLLRGVSATGDVSFLGIQGLLGLGHTPGAYGKAWGAAMKAFADPEMLGKAIEEFDARSVAQNLPDSREWLKAGLHMGGSDTEYAIGQATSNAAGAVKQVQRIGNLRGLKESNRAFGIFGDTLRLEAAQAMQLANPGASMEELAKAANLMTGWTGGKFLGDVGDYVQFAPRFFQSQLDLMAKALTDRSVTGQQARQMLGKMIGIGALTTYGVNQALGEPTDLNPNSNNFMRIRAMGRDVSLFGPWDSLMRAIVHGGQGDFEYVARTKASPLVRLTWDALTGSTFTGDKALNPLKPVEAVTQPERLVSFLQNFVPMSGQELPGTIKGVATGDVSLPNAVAGQALNLTGIKASALSKADVLDELARDAYDTDWEQLTGGQIARLADKFPDRITPTQARKAAGIKNALQPYLDIENQVWAKVRARPEFHGYATLSDYVQAKAHELSQMGVPREQIGQKLNTLPIVRQVGSAVSELHDRYRVAHPDVDQILVDWYGANPIQRRGGSTPPKAQTASFRTATASG